MTEGLARADAHKWHYAVLASLDQFGPASQADLSRRTGIYRSDMVGVLNELAARDLVERTPDPDDRRRNVITITPAGHTRLTRLDEILDVLHNELLAPLTPPRTHPTSPTPHPPPHPPHPKPTRTLKPRHRPSGCRFGGFIPLRDRGSSCRRMGSRRCTSRRTDG
ncbi:MarR family winged helix-turn-helix transcriptional regulator [Actinocorallia lasiicapitis]